MNYNFENPKIQLKMKHNIIKNMPYFLLHDLIKYKCLTAFIKETIHFQCLFGNFNYDGKNLQRFNNSYEALLYSFAWNDSLCGINYWNNLHLKMVSNRNEKKK